MPEKRKTSSADTKTRILDAAERLYVEQGAEGVSLRPLTAAAGANIAAVNYHFGGRDNLLKAMLLRRLDPLHQARDRLLAACVRRWGADLRCEHVLAALFIPALQQARGAGDAGYDRMRFFGRVYSEATPLVDALVKARYEATQRRFLAEFARCLPELSLPDLKLRLSFVMKAVAGVVAAGRLREILVAFGRESAATPDILVDVAILASLGNLMAGALTAPARTDARLRIFDDVFTLADYATASVDAGPADRATPMGAAE